MAEQDTTVSKFPSRISAWADRDGRYHFESDDHDRPLFPPGKQALYVRADLMLTPEALADALECFWNAALGSQHLGNTPVACIAVGFQAVAARLREVSNG